MPNDPKEVLNFLQDTLALFIESQNHIVLYDTVSQNKRVPFGPVNEGRNVCFHLYKAVRDASIQGKTQENLLLARDHLRRSCFDAYILLCGYFISEIETIEEKYPITEIKSGYPKYFDEIKTDISMIKGENVQMRTLKMFSKPAFSKEDKAKRRHDNINLLHSHFEKISDIILCIEAEKTRKFKDSKKEREQERLRQKHTLKVAYLKVFFAAFGSFIVAFLIYYFGFK